MGGAGENMGKTVLKAGLLWLCLFAVGCVHPAFIPVQPESVASLTISDLQEKTMGVEIALVVRSDAKDDLELRDVQAAITVSGVEMGTATLDPLSLPAGQRTNVSLALEVPYASLGLELLEAFQSGEIPYSASLTGTVASTGGLHVRTRLQGKMAVAKDTSLQVASQVGRHHFHLKGLQIRGVGLTGLRVGIEGAVHNPFPFPITVQSIRYHATVEGTDVGKGTLDQPVRLSPGQNTPITLEHRFFPTDPFGTLKMLGTLSSDTRARVEGTLEIEPLGGIREIPFVVDVPILASAR